MKATNRFELQDKGIQVITYEEALEEFKQNLIETIRLNDGKLNGYEYFLDNPVNYEGSSKYYDESWMDWADEFGFVSEYEAYSIIQKELIDEFEIESTYEAWFVTEK